jgi:hypothetical protein
MLTGGESNDDQTSSGVGAGVLWEIFDLGRKYLSLPLLFPFLLFI